MRRLLSTLFFLLTFISVFSIQWEYDSCSLRAVVNVTSDADYSNININFTVSNVNATYIASNFPAFSFDNKNIWMKVNLTEGVNVITVYFNCTHNYLQNSSESVFLRSVYGKNDVTSYTLLSQSDVESSSYDIYSFVKFLDGGFAELFFHRDKNQWVLLSSNVTLTCNQNSPSCIAESTSGSAVDYAFTAAVNFSIPVRLVTVEEKPSVDIPEEVYTNKTEGFKIKDFLSINATGMGYTIFLNSSEVGENYDISQNLTEGRNTFNITVVVFDSLNEVVLKEEKEVTIVLDTKPPQIEPKLSGVVRVFPENKTLSIPINVTDENLDKCMFSYEDSYTSFNCKEIEIPLDKFKDNDEIYIDVLAFDRAGNEKREMFSVILDYPTGDVTISRKKIEKEDDTLSISLTFKCVNDWCYKVAYTLSCEKNCKIEKGNSNLLIEVLEKGVEKTFTWRIKAEDPYSPVVVNFNGTSEEIPPIKERRGGSSSHSSSFSPSSFSSSPSIDFPRKICRNEKVILESDEKVAIEIEGYGRFSGKRFEFIFDKTGKYKYKITFSSGNSVSSTFEVVECEERERSGTTNECKSNGDCNYDEICVNGRCEKISCSCGYIKNHTCIAYECCLDEECGYGKKCINHRCVEVKENATASIKTSAPTGLLISTPPGTIVGIAGFTLLLLFLFLVLRRR